MNIIDYEYQIYKSINGSSQFALLSPSDYTIKNESIINRTITISGLDCKFNDQLVKYDAKVRAKVNWNSTWSDWSEQEYPGEETGCPPELTTNTPKLLSLTVNPTTISYLICLFQIL